MQKPDWNQLVFKWAIVKHFQKEEEKSTFDLMWRQSSSTAELFTKLENYI